MLQLERDVHLKQNLFNRAVLSQKNFLAMGTWVSVKISHEKNRSELAIHTIANIQRQLEQFGVDAWAWGSGQLGDINRSLSAGVPVSKPHNLAPLFDKAWQLSLATKGLYEPRIAELVRLWGFDDPSRLLTEPPSEAAIQQLLSKMQNSQAYAATDCVIPAPSLGWDFGGIGKGYIIDKVLSDINTSELLGVSINAGGNLATRGRLSRKPWLTGIRIPNEDPALAKIFGKFSTYNESVSSHGNDQRCFTYNGVRYGHILNPKTGWPAQGISSVTIVHSDGCVAEAAGAALYIAGLKGWQQLANELDLQQVLVFTDKGEALVSRDLAARLDWRCDIPMQVV